MSSDPRFAAAFVLLFETSVAGHVLADRDAVEPLLDDLRHLISLSRKEAQYLLDAQHGRLDEAAFVLAYEGICRGHVEPDFVFTSGDILRLTAARQQLRMSRQRAIRLLAEGRTPEAPAP